MRLPSLGRTSTFMQRHTAVCMYIIYICSCNCLRLLLKTRAEQLTPYSVSLYLSHLDYHKKIMNAHTQTVKLQRNEPTQKSPTSCHLNINCPQSSGRKQRFRFHHEREIIVFRFLPQPLASLRLTYSLRLVGAMALDQSLFALLRP